MIQALVSDSFVQNPIIPPTRGEMSFVVAAGAAGFGMSTQDEGALTLQRARAQTVRFVCKRGKAELRPFIVGTKLELDLCTVDVCAS